MTLLIVFAVMFGIFLVLVQFLQAVLGYSALARRRPALLPMAVVMMPLSAVAPTIAQRVGTRRMLLLGVGAVRPSGWRCWRRWCRPSGGYLVGAARPARRRPSASACAMTPSTTAITESLPPEKQGVASALNDTVRELGGAVGIALLGSLVSAGYRSSVRDATDEPVARPRPPRSRRASARRSPPPATSVPTAPAVLDAARDALVDGWRLSMWFGVALAAGAFVFLVVPWSPPGRRGPRGRPRPGRARARAGLIHPRVCCGGDPQQALG